jgi:hypothetical protein
VLAAQGAFSAAAALARSSTSSKKSNGPPGRPAALRARDLRFMIALPSLHSPIVSQSYTAVPILSQIAVSARTTQPAGILMVALLEPNGDSAQPDRLALTVKFPIKYTPAASDLPW